MVIDDIKKKELDNEVAKVHYELTLFIDEEESTFMFSDPIEIKKLLYSLCIDNYKKFGMFVKKYLLNKSGFIINKKEVKK